jgi:hypothetical protein
LPNEYHFVYNSGDSTFGIPGGKWWNFFVHQDPKCNTYIEGCPDTWQLGVGPHIHTDLDGDPNYPYGWPNSYAWWYHYIGGPTFQVSNSIHGDIWQMQHAGDPIAGWADSHLTTIATDAREFSPQYEYENIYCYHYDIDFLVKAYASIEGRIEVDLNVLSKQAAKQVELEVAKLHYGLLSFLAKRDEISAGSSRPRSGKNVVELRLELLRHRNIIFLGRPQSSHDKASMITHDLQPERVLELCGIKVVISHKHFHLLW